MATGDNVLHLVIADDSLNDAEHLVSVLRNAGMAVRPTRIQDDEELEQVLAGRAQDLFLCAPGLDSLPMETAFRILEQSGKDIPMLVLSEDEDAELRREVMTMGAVDMVSKSDTEHFQNVIRRELHNLRARRQVRRLEAALRESERRAQQLLNSSRDAIAYVHDGMHVYANTSYLERFGFEAMEELEGLPLLDLVSGDDQKRLKEFLRAYNKGEQQENYVEITVQPTDQEAPQPIEMHFSEATWDGEACTQILIPEQRQVEAGAAATEGPRRDEATALYQRRHFIEELEHRIADTLRQDAGGQVGLLYISPDNLDTVRQNIGITAVDVVMGDIAEIVTAHLDEKDAAGRFSDEVITVMLTGQGVHEALAMAETIRGDVESRVSEVGDRSVANACSIGVAVLGDNLANTDRALNLADEACQQARSEGGNRVQLYSSSDERADEEGVDWERRITDALEDGGLFLHYQPLVALEGDQTPRYEARVRLTGEEGDELGPGEFMPYADELGLTPRIDRWVLTEVVRQLAAQKKAGKKTIMFMKVGGPTLSDGEFLNVVDQTLNEHGVEGWRLTFEVNEPIAVTQLNQAKQFYKAVKELKCGFVLDEFGSGLNPFQLLKHLPAEHVKLDRTVIEQLSRNDGDPDSVREIIETAHEMRKKVIGGYVEGAMELAQLWQYDIDLVQGNFLAAPGPDMNYDFTGMVM